MSIFVFTSPLNKKVKKVLSIQGDIRFSKASYVANKMMYLIKRHDGPIIILRDLF